METIKPTKKEVFNSLRANGCCWLGGKGCQCYSRKLAVCYKDEEKRLTRTVYIDEEIKQNIIENQKAMAEIDKAIDEFFS